jgi:protein ImuB
MFAAALIPNFELQAALRAEPELGAAAVALVAETIGGGGPTIRQINAAAKNSGVAVGMSAPQAQARCLELVFRRQNRRQEDVAAATLLQAAERASPYLENTLPGCCTLDLRRHGELDHAAWANVLVVELQLLHLQAQVGIAPTPDAALQAAQLARPVLIADDSLQSLAQLPVLVLAPSEPVLDVLYDWGIQCVADLRALDRQEVAERLGIEGLALWDRAAGGNLRPLRLVRASEIYEELAEFEGGLDTLKPLLFRLRRSLEQVTRRLRADLLLAGAIELTLDLDDGSTLARTIHIPAPTCETETLFRVVGAYLDTVKTDSRVNGFRLRAWSSAPRDRQAHLWETSLRDPNAFSETLARLSGIVGAEHVGTPVRLPTHRPNSFRLSEVRFDAESPPSGSRHRKVSPHPAAPGFLPLGLSLRRYRPPWRISVESEQSQPVWMRGRDLEGQICASAGPWRMDGQCWDEKAAWRWEEWDVELAKGGLYRLANHRQADWWMLGVYD